MAGASKSPKRKLRSVKGSIGRPKVSAKSLANLRPATKGEVRNPTGTNGWTKAREQVRELLAESAEPMTEKLIKLAKRGDARALRIALGPLMPIVEQKVEHEHTGAVTFRWEGDAPQPNGHAPSTGGSDGGDRDQTEGVAGGS